MKNIGLRADQAIKGKDVYFYSFFSRETQSNSEPKKTLITSELFWIGEQYTVKVEGISGVVAITHLSKEYYSEQYNKVSDPQSKYKKYLEVGDCFDSFSSFLNIVPPKREYDRRWGIRFVSRKYSGIQGSFCSTIKDARDSYKIELKNHLRKSR